MSELVKKEPLCCRGFLLILTVAINSLADVLETIVIQITEETGVALVSKVLGTDSVLKHNRNMDLEGSAMGHPGDPLFKVRLREDVVNLLGEGHLLDLIGVFIINFRFDSREITVRMVHGTTRSCIECEMRGII